MNAVIRMAIMSKLKSLKATEDAEETVAKGDADRDKG
jgi:hypothetical protein